jgi:hypothetical protein
MKLHWKSVLFAVRWHSKGIIHATSRRSLLRNSVKQWPVQQWHARPFLHNGVFQQCPRFPLRNIVYQQSDLCPHCCSTTTHGHAGCLSPRKNATDRHGRTLKVFFVHARAWRTPKKCYFSFVKGCIPHSEYFSNKAECWWTSRLLREVWQSVNRTDVFV